METIALDVQARPGEKKTSHVRAEGMIPAVCYGAGHKSQPLAVRYQAFTKAYEKGGRSTIITLHTDDKKELPVLINEIQYDPKSDAVIHVDFLVVDLNKEIRTQIPIAITGVSPAVKDLAGVLIQNKQSVAVSCLPKHLVHAITIDISSLATLHSSITIKDIVPPEGIKLLDAPEINVVTIGAQRAEEEVVKPVVAAVEGAPVAGAEGAPAAAGVPGAPAATAEKKSEKKKEDKK